MQGYDGEKPSTFWTMSLRITQLPSLQFHNATTNSTRSLTQTWLILDALQKIAI